MVTVNPATATTDTTANPTKSEAAKKRLDESYHTFLGLMTQQWQNQDPLSPMDTNQLTQQLVQMTSVEQSIHTNSHLEALLDQNKRMELVSALSLVGKQVKVESDKISYQNGQKVAFEYELPADAESVQIQVRDVAGKVINAINGPKKSGMNALFWDGLKSDNTVAQSGEYTIKVVALDKNQKAIPTKTYTFAAIDGVNYETDDPFALIRNQKIALERIREVYKEESPTIVKEVVNAAEQDKKPATEETE